MKRFLASNYPIIITLVAFLVLFLYLFTPGVVIAKNRLDLEDIAIKGQLHNDNRLNILGRQRNELKNYVKFRTNYRSEIIEGLPTPAPDVRRR
jgi:hypothetical protein